MYKVFSLAPMFIPYGVYQTYEEAFAVVKRVDDFLMVIDECNEDGSIIDKYQFKKPFFKNIL